MDQRHDGKEALREAFLALLKDKSLAKITVADIAGEAHVSRTTFYRHFGSTGDVLESVIDELLARIYRVDDQLGAPDALDPADNKHYELVVYGRLLAYRENQELLRTLLGSDARELLRQRLTDAVVSERSLWARVRGEMPAMPTDSYLRQLERVELYNCTGIVAVLIRWVESGCVDAPETLCDFIVRAAQDSYALLPQDV